MTRMPHRIVALPVLVLSATLAGQRAPQPIIDVHLHALPIGAFGKPPATTCAPVRSLLPRDPKDAFDMDRFAECAAVLRSPLTDAELMGETLATMRRMNIIAVASGPIDLVRKWKAAAPTRVIPALNSGGQIPPDTVRALAKDGSISVLGELGFQYNGLAPTDPLPEGLFSVAEELDLPVGIHMGPGAPGAAYFATPKYEMRLTNPMLLEPILVRHPKLRLYVMHAGWPMADQMIGLLYAHPQVYVDVSLLNWYLPRKEFHAYLQRLIDAGFDKRIMFGSDQTVWPGAIPLAIQAIESARFLTAAQRRDIFYNNAARFLRLKGSH